MRAWRAARRADVVHAIKDYPHSLVALLAAQLAGKPCVATAHGTYTVQPLLDHRHAKLSRWTYRRFAALIAVSGYTARRLAEVAGESGMPRNVRTIPNCVELGPLEAAIDVGDRPWHHWPFTLGLGETKERKGHHLALAAWCRVARKRPELRHVIVGKLSGDEYEARLRRIVEANGLSDRVHFLGNVPEPVKVDLVRRCEALVHTPVTAADGGIVYLEASACGRPVLGTRGCGAEDAIVDGRTGFLVDPEEDKVADALKRLLDDPALAARMGEAGRVHARENTWEKNAREVAALYREVVG
jgi:glycosyltransferase involved in cell wall biosynthesis